MREEGDYIPSCHHHNYFCIQIGCNESHFNGSLIIRDKVTRQCPQTTTFEEKGESRSGFEPKSLSVLTSLMSYR